ncbi:hypothetical protein DPMN_041956 [Dreissena polymorpha]|uniref:Uncharacterized protein n=1 Tax=Dreissena polymorpha TaxID=45954 RepID=A0A9D4HWM1_DREPO|nr:hypothetical protein DPMN_041956 [Dreissena polymorpha]
MALVEVGVGLAAPEHLAVCALLHLHCWKINQCCSLQKRRSRFISSSCRWK